MVTRLSVVYKNPEVDEELDKKIIEFFALLGFGCIDRTYFNLIFRREIFFEKQSGEIEDGSKRNKEAQLKT